MFSYIKILRVTIYKRKGSIEGYPKFPKKLHINLCRYITGIYPSEYFLRR